jgi:hypothetical protein
MVRVPLMRYSAVSLLNHPQFRVRVSGDAQIIPGSGSLRWKITILAVANADMCVSATCASTNRRKQLFAIKTTFNEFAIVHV